MFRSGVLFVAFVVAACGGDDAGTAPDAGRPVPPDAVPVESPDYADVDYEIDEVFEGRWTYDHDGAGHRLLEELDRELDGVIDTRYVTTYDRDYLHTQALDEDADGTPEWAEEHAYDARGRELTVRRDTDGDGAIDSVDNHEYSSEGLRVFTRIDSNGDGTIDDVSRYIYAGVVLDRIELDFGQTGNVDIVTTYFYDAQGRSVRVETDIDLDGVADQVVAMTYDAVNRILTSEFAFDGDNDGILEQRTRETNTYDGGRLVITDIDANGVRERRRYHYP